MKKYSLSFIFFIFIISALVGFVRYGIYIHNTGDSYLKNLVGQKAIFQGTIVSEPDERDNSTRFVVALDHADDYEINKTKIILSDAVYSKLQYGDVITIEGKLKEPENFETDTGKTFDYISYLKKDKIFYQ